MRFVIGDSNHESPNQQSQSTEAVTPKLHSSVGGRPFLCRAVARTPSGLDVTFRRRSHKNRRWRSRPRRQPGGDCGGNGITNGATGKRRRTGGCRPAAEGGSARPTRPHASRCRRVRRFACGPVGRAGGSASRSPVDNLWSPRHLDDSVKSLLPFVPVNPVAPFVDPLPQ